MVKKTETLFHKFVTLMEAYAPLEDGELLLLQGILKKKTYDRNELIFTEGKISPW